MRYGMRGGKTEAMKTELLQEIERELAADPGKELRVHLIGDWGKQVLNELDQKVQEIKARVS